MTPIDNHINHIAFVIDASGSMAGLTVAVIKTFDQQIASLARQSKEMDQETRVTVYIFEGGRVNCVIFDKDVLRLPSLASLYQTGGSTNLIAATLMCLGDLHDTLQKYGDHAFLIYVLTDGEETDNKALGPQLSRTISALSDNWTVATLVPDERCRQEAKRYGFPEENIMIWDTTAHGLEELGKKLDRVHAGYFTARKAGVRKFSSLFQLDLSKLTRKDVRKNLDALDINSYRILEVRRKEQIRDRVERDGLNYFKGCAFYQLTKKVLVQEYKEVIVRDRANDRIYGGPNARSVLGIPENTRINLTPEMLGKFDVFIQSTSVNRALIPGTDLIVMVA